MKINHKYYIPTYLIALEYIFYGIYLLRDPEVLYVPNPIDILAWLASLPLYIVVSKLHLSSINEVIPEDIRLIFKSSDPYYSSPFTFGEWFIGSLVIVAIVLSFNYLLVRFIIKPINRAAAKKSSPPPTSGF